jgi:hypothetical protein
MMTYFAVALAVGCVVVRGESSGAVTDFSLVGKPATQSTTGWGGAASRAVDGDTNGKYSAGHCTHTNGVNSWWKVDLGTIQTVGEVKVFGRTDWVSERLNGMKVRIGNDATNVANNAACYTLNKGALNGSCNSKKGRFLSVNGPGKYMSLCGVKIKTAHSIMKPGAVVTLKGGRLNYSKFCSDQALSICPSLT